MSIESQFIVRLAAIEPQVFRIIGGAAEFASIAGEPKAFPAAYVMVEEEQSGEPISITGPVLQQTQADVAVVIFVRDVSDNTGGAAAAGIATLKQIVRDALIGFTPSLEGAEPIVHVSANLLKAKSGTVCQRELFGAGYYTSEAGS